MHQASTRQGLAAPTTWVLFLFLLCSLLGRFGVAFLGFAFNLDNVGTTKYQPPLFKTDWVNMTLQSAKIALIPKLNQSEQIRQ